MSEAIIVSKEQAAKFLKKLSTDQSAADKFKEAFRAAMLKMGKDTGFKFTREELEQALVEMKNELPEDALNAVSGGGLAVPLSPLSPIVNRGGRRVQRGPVADLGDRTRILSDPVQRGPEDTRLRATTSSTAGV